MIMPQQEDESISRPADVHISSLLYRSFYSSRSHSWRFIRTIPGNLSLEKLFWWPNGVKSKKYDLRGWNVRALKNFWHEKSRSMFSSQRCIATHCIASLSVSINKKILQWTFPLLAVSCLFYFFFYLMAKLLELKIGLNRRVFCCPKSQNALWIEDVILWPIVETSLYLWKLDAIGGNFRGKGGSEVHCPPRIFKSSHIPCMPFHSTFQERWLLKDTSSKIRNWGHRKRLNAHQCFW